jgi:hypothetical protein
MSEPTNAVLIYDMLTLLVGAVMGFAIGIGIGIGWFGGRS